MKPSLISIIILLLLLAAKGPTLQASALNNNEGRNPGLEYLDPLVKTFTAYQRGNDYVLQVVPALYWEKVSYYILDKNKSILGGGSLAPHNNTIVLSKYPKGEYSICIRAKGAAVNKTFVIR